jgi:type II secretory pathway pseudopilin PulG
MSRKGFTLVELLIVMFMGIIVMVAIYATMGMGQHSSGTVGRKVVTQQDTRSVLDLITMETRMASYAPDGADKVTWQAFKTSCANGVLVAGNKGIQWADKNSIAIEMDLDNNHAIAGGNELIYYSYDAANCKNNPSDPSACVISRQVGCGGPLTPILGGAGTETKVVNSLTLPAATPLFRYFDSKDNDISDSVVSTPNDLAVGIPAVRRIEITIVADILYTDLQMSTVNRTMYSTSFIVRNHVL